MGNYSPLRYPGGKSALYPAISGIIKSNKMDHCIYVEPFAGGANIAWSLLIDGVVDFKYFYRVVSRGYWSQDRKYWRFFSPWISACVAFVVGCMVLSGYINATQTQSFAAEICVGFITGYFADEAVGKMSEVATALFGSNSKTDPNKVDSNSNVGSNK